VRERVVDNLLLFWGFLIQTVSAHISGWVHYRDWTLVMVLSGRLEHGGGNVCINTGSLGRTVFLECTFYLRFSVCLVLSLFRFLGFSLLFHWAAENCLVSHFLS